uniref:Uncharacterized protein n=1 Tax=Anguilla anguilla TaxID=7936 RepID=A0A0E9X6L3_ANGAN
MYWYPLSKISFNRNKLMYNHYVFNERDIQKYSQLCIQQHVLQLCVLSQLFNSICGDPFMVWHRAQASATTEPRF